MVLVATVRAMKMNGGLAKADLGPENVTAVQAGCSNLGRHIENLKSFGVPVIVAINHFVTDTEAEVQAVKEYVVGQGSEAIVSQHWEFGSKGSEALAIRVAEIADADIANFAPIYPDEEWEDQGYGHLPVCMAKTQYSFSTDPNLRGAPVGHSVPVREVRLSAGAGFVVVVCGEIMTMPGLPRTPAAETIRLNDAGEIEGLF